MTADSDIASLTLRAAIEADLPLLRRIYAGTREEELAMVPWSSEQKAAFCEMQFQAQHTDYHLKYPNATFEVVEMDGVGVGRLYVDPRMEEVRILDIAILSEFRGQGIGTQLLTEIFAEAEALGVPVTIHVERRNQAQTWYRRLGFVEVGADAVYLLMQRGGEPGAVAGCTSQITLFN